MAISTIVTLLAIYFPCLYNFILFLTRMDADTRVRSGLSSTICPGTCYWQDPGLLLGVFMSNIDLFFLLLIVNLHQLAIMNGSGVIGRMSANYLAESYGVWNMQVPVTFISGVTVMATLGMWVHLFFNSIPSQSNNILIKSRNGPVSLIVVSILYGFFSSACQYFKIVKKRLKTNENSMAWLGMSLALAGLSTLAQSPQEVGYERSCCI